VGIPKPSPSLAGEPGLDSLFGMRALNTGRAPCIFSVEILASPAAAPLPLELRRSRPRRSSSLDVFGLGAILVFATDLERDSRLTGEGFAWTFFFTLFDLDFFKSFLAFTGDFDGDFEDDFKGLIADAEALAGVFAGVLSMAFTGVLVGFFYEAFAWVFVCDLAGVLASVFAGVFAGVFDLFLAGVFVLTDFATDFFAATS